MPKPPLSATSATTTTASDHGHHQPRGNAADGAGTTHEKVAVRSSGTKSSSSSNDAVAATDGGESSSHSKQPHPQHRNGLEPGPTRSGVQGVNTEPHHKGNEPDLPEVDMGDGFKAFAEDAMWRSERGAKGRREASFREIHNLHMDVIRKTQRPRALASDVEIRRGRIWDAAAAAVKQALFKIKPKPGDHVVVCANSGPWAEGVEDRHPRELLAGATHGIFFVAEFRPDDKMHPAWHQVAVPIKQTEGRLLAGLRLLPSIVGHNVPDGVFFHVANGAAHFETSQIQHELGAYWSHPDIQHGCVARSWIPTNLGCWHSRGAVFRNDALSIRNSFGTDGDLYGWDEAIIYTRQPVALIASDRQPPWHYNTWRTHDKAYANVTWLRVRGGKLVGGKVARTMRRDVIHWGEGGPRDWPLYRAGVTMTSPSMLEAEAKASGKKKAAAE